MKLKERFKSSALMHTRPMVATMGVTKQSITFFNAVMKEYSRNNCFVRASGLAFTTILALVPLTVVVVSLLTALGALGGFFEYIKDFLSNQLIPAYRDVIVNYLNQFIMNTKALGSFGSVFFLITSIFLFNNISSNFNALWMSFRRITFVSQLKTYLSILLGGSIFISLAVTASSTVTGLFQLQGFEATGALFQLMKLLSPPIFLFLCFLLMLIFIPTAKVKLTCALFGATIGVVIWEVAALVFNYWVSQVVKIHLIYGPLAAIPLLLIWLYVIWLIVLLMVIATRVFQNRNYLLRTKLIDRFYPDEFLMLGTAIFTYICSRYKIQKTPPNTAKLSRRYYCTEKQIQDFVEIFLEAGLLHHVSAPVEGYIPSRSLAALNMSDITGALFHSHSPLIEGTSPGWEHDAVRELIDSVCAQISSPKKAQTMEDFLVSHLPVKNPS